MVPFENFVFPGVEISSRRKAKPLFCAPRFAESTWRRPISSWSRDVLTRVCAAGWKVGAIVAPGSEIGGSAGRGGGALQVARLLRIDDSRERRVEPDPFFQPLHELPVPAREVRDGPVPLERVDGTARIGDDDLQVARGPPPGELRDELIRPRVRRRDLGRPLVDLGRILAPGDPLRLLGEVDEAEEAEVLRAEGVRAVRLLEGLVEAAPREETLKSAEKRGVVGEGLPVQNGHPRLGLLQERPDDSVEEELLLDGREKALDLVRLRTPQEEAEKEGVPAELDAVFIEHAGQLVLLGDRAGHLHALLRLHGVGPDRVQDPPEREERRNHREDDQRQDRPRQDPPNERRLLLARGRRAGLRDEPLLGEDLLLVEILDEEGARFLEDVLEALDDVARGTRRAFQEVARGLRNRLALLDAARDVEPAEDERLVVAALRQDAIEIAPDRVLQGAQLLGEDEEPVGVRDVFLAREKFQPELVNARDDLIPGRVHDIRVVRFLGAGGVRPAEELALLDRVELREELREPERAVGLGDQEEDREPDVEEALNVDQLRPDVLRLLVLLFRRVLEERRARNDHEDAVDGAVAAMLSEELEEARPLRRVGSRFLLEREASGRVQDDGLVREPPVAIARPAGARERVSPNGEFEPRVLEGRAFSRLRLPDEEVPGQRVDVEASRLQILHRLQPLDGEVLQRLAHLLLRRAGGLRVFPELALERLALLLLTPLAQHLEEEDGGQNDEQPEQEEPPVFLEPEKADEEVAEGNEQDGAGEVLERPWKPLDQREELLHDVYTSPIP